jgi:phytoene dehydrogenase-like protein
VPVVSTHDVVVIGAGHNGLTAACYLARSGLDVTVLEAGERVGGMTSTMPTVAGAPHHLMNVGALDATFIHGTDIVTDLGLKDFGYREVWLDPIWAYLHDEDDLSLLFWRDPRRTADEIERFSRADAAAYLDLTRTLDALISLGSPLLAAHPTRPGRKALTATARAGLKHRKDVGAVVSLLASSCAEVIDERFRHPIVRGALGSLCSAFGPILADGTSVVLLALGWYLRYGVNRPIGGTQAFPDALQSALEKLGGSVQCGAPVAEVLVTNGGASGVLLDSGETIMARHAVLATCDPRTALLSLLPTGTLEPTMEARASRIPTLASNLATLRVDVAASGRLTLGRFERRRGDGVDLRLPGVYMGTLENAIAAETAAAAGRLPEVTNLYAAIPTGPDPSQAPDGQDTLWLYAHPMPLHPTEPWESLRDKASAHAVARAAQFIDGIDEFEIGRTADSPVDMARRFRVSGGSLWHVDLSVFRLGPLRPARRLAGYRTPVGGYYLGSGGSHPTPGMSGMPGRLASDQIRRDIKRGKRR